MNAFVPRRDGRPAGMPSPDPADASQCSTSLRTTSLERFVSASGAHLPPLEVVPQTPKFRATLRGRNLQRGQLIQLASSPVRVTRTPRMARHTSGAHAFKLVWQLRGGAEMEQGDRAIRLGAGQMAIYRLSTPYRLHTFGDYRVLMLSLDLADMPEWRQLAERCQGQVLPWDAAVQGALEALRSQLVWGDDPMVARVEEMALELVFDFLWRGQWQQLHCAPMPSARLVRARRLVLQRLADPALAPEDLAQALNLSMRALYDEFRRHQLAPPAAFIRELRLDHCYLALLDAANRRHTITHIALEHGFVDGAHFARIFRQRYGISPIELRRRQQEKKH
ncbi:helix-turn-helix domain-containing protein [Halomonas faecis]|uniref:helix-turn-helix domain-containing protein n=1 Tax=Halomonas faecis TaxID=1562110 RepID=UPI0013D2D740|nr:helix-turn-helix domain-containing protein [Halomonas faecis]